VQEQKTASLRSAGNRVGVGEGKTAAKSIGQNGVF